MDEKNLVQLSKSFAIRIIQICKEIRTNRNETVLVNQLLRSGTSIGANIHEGNYASSRLDFIN
jgi:four helix bundle protein